MSRIQTTVRQAWLAVGWLLVLLVIYLSLTPAPVVVPMGLGDKGGHLLAYFAMMFWFACACTATGQRVKIACGLITLGIALEFAQLHTGYRSFEINDMIAGAAGVALGWSAAPPRLPNALEILLKWLLGKR